MANMAIDDVMEDLGKELPNSGFVDQDQLHDLSKIRYEDTDDGVRMQCNDVA